MSGEKTNFIDMACINRIYCPMFPELYQSLLDNFSKHYNGKELTVIEFLKSEHLNWEDKKSVVFSTYMGDEFISSKVLRDFSAICFKRAYDYLGEKNDEPNEDGKIYILTIQDMKEQLVDSSIRRWNIDILNPEDKYVDPITTYQIAAENASRKAIKFSNDRSTEEKEQLDILIKLIEEELK